MCAAEEPEEPTIGEICPKGGGLAVYVRHCARCHEDHVVAFMRFKNGIVVEGKLHDYWGMCSNTGEPVLMRIEQTVG